MTVNILEKIIEHNNWANLEIIRVCTALNDDQLDAPPQSATYGSIRSTLQHLVVSQESYLRFLTLPPEMSRESFTVTYDELEQVATSSGEGLLALAPDASNLLPKLPLPSKSGHLVEAWVVMVQVINHATEHREQIKSMLTALGITPPYIGGWSFGEHIGALVPISS